MAAKRKPLTTAQLNNFIDDLDNGDESDGFSDFDDGRKIFSYLG